MSKERLIKSISLNANGLKGLTLKGEYETIKENKIVTNDFTDVVRTPIHLDLESKIEDLRIHVLTICGLNVEGVTSKNRLKELLSDCNIVSFEFRKGKLGWIKIKATSRLFETDFQTITTPKVSDEKGYENFEPLMDTLDEILYEVDQYTKGLKKLSEKELAVSWIRHKGGDITMDTLNTMTEEEISDFCKNHIEKKLGGFVILQEDVAEADTFEEELVEIEQSMNEPHSTGNVIDLNAKAS
jgi:hypothetical protein